MDRQAGGPPVRFPRCRHVPQSGVVMRPSVRSSVVFPAPEGPTIDTNSPGRTVRVTSRLTGSTRPSADVRLLLTPTTDRNGGSGMPAPGDGRFPPQQPVLRQQEHGVGEP